MAIRVAFDDYSTGSRVQRGLHHYWGIYPLNDDGSPDLANFTFVEDAIFDGPEDRRRIMDIIAALERVEAYAALLTGQLRLDTTQRLALHTRIAGIMAGYAQGADIDYSTGEVMALFEHLGALRKPQEKKP